MNVDTPARQNPFPGLRPFTTEEDYLFFGREEQTTELLGLLRQHRFLAVVGTSGSGKSSLVRAGLLPALHGGTMAQAGSAWEVLVLRPGGDPLANLARALVDADLYDALDEETLPRVVATLNRSRLGLVEAVRQSGLPAGTNLLVVVDQFEELFRFRQAGSTHQEAAAAFVKLLLAAAREPDQRLYIAITMRSDYLGECSHLAGLAEAVNDGEYLIPRLSRDQRRAAIEKPVSVGGGTISHRLVQKLLNDVGDDADHLPVLQHALMRIFDYWAEDHAEGEPLDLRHYERAGGLQEALSRHSDEVFAELPTDRLRTVTEKIFKALTERGPDNRGIRRPTRLDTLGAIADATQEEVVAVVEAFRRSGRTFLMPMSEVELVPTTPIDISHESLMRVWKRLDRWVEEESQSARIYRRLADTAALHAEGKAGIYHDPDLQIALSWRETELPTEAWAARYHPGFEQAMAFLMESRDVQHAEAQELETARRRELKAAKKLAKTERLRADEQKRSAQRMKSISGGAAFVAVAALMAFAVALVLGIQAFQKEKEAEKNALLAEANAADAQKNADRANKSALDAQASAKEASAQKEIAQASFRKALKAVDEYFINVSESRLLRVPGLQPLRKELLQSALAYYEGFVQQHGDDPALKNDLAEAYTRVARITGEIGDKAKALEMMSKALPLRVSLLASNPTDVNRKLDLAVHHQAVGNLHRELGNASQAMKSLDEAHKRLLAISPQTGRTVMISLMSTNIGGVKAYESNDPIILSAFASVLSDKAAAYVAANDLQSALVENYSAIYIRRNLISRARQGGAPLLNRTGQLSLKSNSGVDGKRLETHPFAMQAGKAYTIDMKSFAFDAYLMVRDPQGKTLAQDDDGGEGTNSRIAFSPPSTGQYTLVATSLLPGKIGPYTLTVRGENQGKVVFDKSGRLEPKDARDNFGRSYRAHIVKMEAGRSYLLSASSPGGEISPILTVWDGNKVTAQGNTKNAWGSADVAFTPPRTGSFKLNVASLVKDKLGAYRLTVVEQKKNNLLFDKLDLLSPAAPRDKRGAYFKVYELKLQAGDRCIVDLTAMDKKLDPFLRIEDAEGKLLAVDDDSGGALNSRLIFRPKVAGMYRFVATSFLPGDTGRYRLSIKHEPMDAALVPLEYRLAQQWMRLGELMAALDMVEAAVPYQVEAKNILLGLVAGYPEHDLASAFERDLAASHENMGDLLFKSKGEPEALEASRQKAAQAYQQAAAIRQKMAQLNPAVTEYQAELARTFYALANTQAALGQTDAALEAYANAIKHQDIVFATGPTVRVYAQTLGRYQVALGQLQQRTGKTADALKSFRSARKYLEKPPPTQPGAWFELALVRAACSQLDPPQKEKDADQAIAALQSAAAAGFEDFEQVDKASELEPLRAREDFQKIAVEVKARSKRLVWIEDFDEAKALAAKEGKDILVYFGGADWATFDVAFRNRVFTQPAFVDFASKHFVMMKVEFFKHRPMSKDSARWYGQLGVKWPIKSFPNLILADGQGRGYAQQSGASGLDAPGFIALLRKHHATRVRRDQALEEAEAAAGVQRAKLLDGAVAGIPPQFLREYNDLHEKVGAQILEADPENGAGLRAKYLGHVIRATRADVQSLVKLQKWPDALAKLNSALEVIRPTGAEGQGFYLDRARLHISLGDFQRAAADFERVHQRNAADPQIWLEHIYCLVHSGDTEEYRRVCAAMLEHFGKKYQPADPSLVAWAAAMTPDAVADWNPVVAFGNKGVARPMSQGFYHHALALAYYRAGDYQKTLEHLGQWDSPLSDLLFALTYKRLGQDKEADQALAKAQQGLQKLSEGKALSAITATPQRDWLVLDILVGEAAAVFEGSPLAADARFQSLRLHHHIRQKQWDKAVTAYGQLLAKQPDNVQLLLERGQCYEKLKEPEKAGADFAKAIDSRNKALKVQRLLLQKDPKATAQRAATAQALRDLADTQRRVGRHAEAAATLGQLADLWAGDGPRIYEAAKQTAALVALAGKDQGKPIAQRALQTLKQGVDAGYLDATALGTEAAFDPLRSDLEFQRLLAEIQVRARFPLGKEMLREFKAHTLAVEAVVVTPDGRRAISGGYDGTLRFWEIDTGKQLRATLVARGLGISGLAISADGRQVLVGCHDKIVRLYDVETGNEIRNFHGHTDKVWTVALSKDGRWALSASEDKTVRLWEVETSKQAGLFQHDAAVWAVAFSPDGLLAVTGDKAQNVQLWDVKKVGVIKRWDTSKDVGRRQGMEAIIWCAAFTPDGSHILAGGSDKMIRVWDVKNQNLVRSFDGHDHWVRFVGFAANPQQVVSGDNKGNLIIWNLQTGKEISRMTALGSRVGLAILPGGGRALTADSDKLVRQWLLPPEAAQARVWVKQGRLAQAEADYALAVKLHPDEIDLRIERGRFFGRFGKWQEAVADFDIALKTDAAGWELWADRGRCLAMLGQSDKAAADFARALDLLPPAPAYRSPRSQLALELAQLEKAFSVLLEQRPDDWELKLARARRFAFLGQWDKASAEYNQVKQTAAVDVLIEQAGARLLAGDVEGYRKLFQTAQETFGKNQDPWIIHCLARIAGMSPESAANRGQAVAWGEQAVAARPDAWHVYSLGLSHHRAGQFKQAAEQFNRSNSLNWGKSTVVNQLGLALAHHQAGDAVQARQSLVKAHTLLQEIIPATPNQLVILHPADWLEAEVLRREAEAVLNAPHRREAEIAQREQKWQEAIEHFDHLLKVNPDFWPDRLARARGYAALKQTKEALQDYEKLLALVPKLNSGTGPAAEHLLFAREFAESLLQARWTTLKPLSPQSAGGATLTVQPDDSVLASGPTPKVDKYTLTAKLPPGRFTGIRIEALPDQSLSARGPGRAFNGNFVLTELVVTVTPAMGKAIPVRFSTAAATFEQVSGLDGNPYGRYSAASAIDGDAKGKRWGWAILPGVGQAQEAVFEFADELTAADATITIELHQNWEYHLLGRFRISLTSDPRPTRYAYLAEFAPQAKVGTAYLALGDARSAADFLMKATAANAKSLPADYLVLALAHARLKDDDQAKKASAKAAELLKPAGADAALHPLLREVVLTLGKEHAAAKELLAAAGGALPPALSEAIQQNPNNAGAHRARGNWFAERGRWKEAGADFTEAFRLEPDAITGMRLGFLLIQTGDLDRYRAHCRAMLDRWATTDKNGEADQTLKSIVLIADFKADAKQLARLAEVAVAGDTNQDWFEWWLLGKGLHDYRAGKYEDALTACRESRRRAPESKGQPQALTALSLTIEAMALERSGDAAGAKRTLSQARSILDLHVPEIDGAWWHDWLAARILFQEGDRLIAASKDKQP